MKTCAACHEDLSKDKFSKKQWKLNQRRCKVCVTDNREVQQLPPSPPTNNEPNNNGVVSSLLGSMSLHDCNTSISDEELFKQPPTNEDCPICFLRMPSLWSGRAYKSCCGKLVCNGCIHAAMMRGTSLCPFCRAPPVTSWKESNKRNEKRMEVKDPHAIYSLGCHYSKGDFGLPQNYEKALELWHQAGELGCSNAYHNIGTHYDLGRGVGVDNKKAKHYYELAAMLGHMGARYNLGLGEEYFGSKDRALKHYMIAVTGEDVDALENIKRLFMEGHATKDDYTKALRSYQECLDEIRSDQRDTAAECGDKFKYY